MNEFIDAVETRDPACAAGAVGGHEGRAFVSPVWPNPAAAKPEAPQPHPQRGLPGDRLRARPHRKLRFVADGVRGGAGLLPLRQTVCQLRRDLHRAEQDRSAALLALEDQATFMAVLAHELRAPLSPIRNAAALLGRVCSPEMNVFVSALLERQTAHAARLVDDLLDVARIRTGKLCLRRSVLDLGALVACAVQTCRPGMEDKAQRLTLESPPTPLWVDGDPDRLMQILNNLLGNASRYTPPGGEIAVTLHAEPGRVILIVKDSGIGIPAQDLHRVFDAYFRQDIAVRCDAAGLGLGLSVVRDLVLAHGGHIAARSDGPGCGSQFDLSLALLTPHGG